MHRNAVGNRRCVAWCGGIIMHRRVRYDDAPQMCSNLASSGGGSVIRNLPILQTSQNFFQKKLPISSNLPIFQDLPISSDFFQSSKILQDFLPNSSNLPRSCKIFFQILSISSEFFQILARSCKIFEDFPSLRMWYHCGISTKCSESVQ